MGVLHTLTTLWQNKRQNPQGNLEEARSQVETERKGNLAILSLSGAIISSIDEDDLKVALDQIVTDGIFRIVVNLERARWLNSSAFGILIAAQNQVRRQGGSVHLVRPNQRIISVFVTMRLEKLFNRYETLDEAIAGFDAA
ncbi:MAG: STAS domain-containing protein [bacterium]|nr:STAS domain-containing protein [bacterium]